MDRAYWLRFLRDATVVASLYGLAIWGAVCGVDRLGWAGTVEYEPKTYAAACVDHLTTSMRLKTNIPSMPLVCVTELVEIPAERCADNPDRPRRVMFEMPPAQAHPRGRYMFVGGACVDKCGSCSGWGRVLGVVR